MRSLRSIIKTVLPAWASPLALETYLYLRSLPYRGGPFVCPCCGGHFRKFLPFGGPEPRLNAQCPRCRSLERHRLLCVFLEDRMGFFNQNLNVLDVAPLQSFQKKCKASANLNYTSADMASPLVDLHIDIMKIPLPENQFDCILCYHVLEHCDDDRKAMKELYRVLRPGGWAIIQSPVDDTLEHTFEDPSVCSPEERQRVFGQSDHQRIYGRDYPHRLEEAGFSVGIDDYAGELGSDVIRTYGLDPCEQIYFCSKAG